MKYPMLIAGAAMLMAATPGPAQSEANEARNGAQTPAQGPLPGMAPTASGNAAAPAGDLLATAQARGEFTTLARAIEAAGMAGDFKGGQFMTLFAPTDAAFAALPAGTVDNLLKPENKAQLKALLSNHLVPGYANSEFLAQQPNSVMATVGGGQVAIASVGGKVTVSGAHLVAADVRATNGLIHGIDKVLMPTDRQAGGAAPAGAYRP